MRELYDMVQARRQQDWTRAANMTAQIVAALGGSCDPYQWIPRDIRPEPPYIPPSQW